MHSPEKMLQIAKVGYLQIFDNVNTISSRTITIALILTILNSNKATNSSELLKIGGNTLAMNSFLTPAMLLHPASRCTSAVPSGGLLPSQILMLNTLLVPLTYEQGHHKKLKLFQLIWLRKDVHTNRSKTISKWSLFSWEKTVINNWKQQEGTSNNRIQCRKIEYSDSAFSCCVIQQNSVDHNGCNL